MDETARRRRRIRELIAEQAIESQEDLVLRLKQDRILVSQPTVSRDLEILDIRKPGRFYLLPEAGGVAQMLRQFALAIEASGNLAVVRTPPGVASAVASAIDSADLPGVLATVQGDDTLLVVAREPTTGRSVADQLTRLKAGTTGDPTTGDPTTGEHST